MDSGFSYDTAFNRNIGWLTGDEQEALRGKRIAIAGMGGVGGYHLLSLARLGAERFNIADFDNFELANFNRQAGSAMSTLGKSKVEVLARQAQDINPHIDIRVFREGVHEQNLSDFFTDVDIYMDGLDFFAFQVREQVFDYCWRCGIPAITAAPLGMGVGLLNFIPRHMHFEEYFRISGRSDLEKGIRFLVGLAPALLHRRYLIDPSRVDLADHKGPSTSIACQLCAGVASAEALKILLKRGKVWAAPHGFQFDAFRNKFIHTWRPGGNRHPLNRIAISAVRRKLGLRA